MFAEVLARNAIDIHSPVGLKIVSFIKTLQVTACACLTAADSFFRSKTRLYSALALLL